MIRIKILQLQSGEEPFKDWLRSLDDESRAAIYAYVDRVSIGGSIKNLKYISDGVHEIKINYGPGYRVYFGRPVYSEIILLIGGDKDSQSRDIVRAIKLWRAHVQK